MPTEAFVPPPGLAPLRLTAREIRGVAESGRSRPLYVDCVGSDGARVTVVLKLRVPGTPDTANWGLCLTRDLVGSVLARRLGLPVPDYAVVSVDRPFIEVSSRHAEGARLQANGGENFGSVRLDSVLEGFCEERSAWAKVLTFDALSYNLDRKPSNPNVLWDGKVLFLIDQGLIAPTWTFAIDGTTSATLYGHANITLHAAFRLLQKAGDAYADTIEAWGEAWGRLITPEFLSWARKLVPAGWATQGQLDELFAFLAARGSIARLQERELVGVLK